LAHYVDMSAGVVRFPDVGIDFAKVSRVTISACGTAYYAGMIAKYWFERYARIPVDVDVASEMRYREPPLTPGGLAVMVSQSGETADTLAALRYCREQGQTIASVVNVTTSTIARESDAILPTLAGPEIGVASTKAFTCQMAVLACLALAVGRARGQISPEMEQDCVRALSGAPGMIAQMLNDKDTHLALAKELARARDVFYLGRGTSYPLALEGALKLKEISYIHAEGFASGELKHGPIALIDESVPVVVLAPLDDLFEKTVSNMQEVAARGAKIIFVSDAPVERAGCEIAHYVHVPSAHAFATPLVYAQPVQFMAYYTAVAMGTDVDQPRNLAKSVTVE
jgi:glucosamine--fructose-6-phosphate aminotransferase (isomerizing)